MRQRHTPYRLGDLSNFLKTTPLLGTQEVMSTGTGGAQTISTMRGKFVRQIEPTSSIELLLLLSHRGDAQQLL